MEWISVKDRLPTHKIDRYGDEVSQEVLVYHRDRKFFVARYFHHHADLESPYWIDSLDTVVAYPVTHWMPLPEPPKGE